MMMSTGDYSFNSVCPQAKPSPLYYPWWLVRVLFLVLFQKSLKVVCTYFCMADFCLLCQWGRNLQQHPNLHPRKSQPTISKRRRRQRRCACEWVSWNPTKPILFCSFFRVVGTCGWNKPFALSKSPFAWSQDLIRFPSIHPQFYIVHRDLSSKCPTTVCLSLCPLSNPSIYAQSLKGTGSS